MDYRDSRLIHRAESVAVGPFPSRARMSEYPRTVKRAEDDAREARTLNPDSAEPILVQAALEVRVGRPASASALLQGLVRDEPKNIRAWAMLAQTTRDSDPALSRRALARAAALDPVFARRLR